MQFWNLLGLKSQKCYNLFWGKTRFQEIQAHLIWFKWAAMILVVFLEIQLCLNSVRLPQVHCGYQWTCCVSTVYSVNLGHFRQPQMKWKHPELLWGMCPIVKLFHSPGDSPLDRVLRGCCDSFCSDTVCPLGLLSALHPCDRWPWSCQHHCRNHD